MDLYVRRKFEVTGYDSEEMIRYTLAYNVHKLGAGKVATLPYAKKHGGTVDNDTLFKAQPGRFIFILDI